VELDRRKVIAARTIAVMADAVQVGLLPLFLEGALSTVNDVLDVAVAGILTALVGWHWAFVPSFVAELVPVLNLAPSWTAAVFIATRNSSAAVSAPEPPLSLPPPSSSQSSPQQPVQPTAKTPPAR
jgi:hypothetical protein